MEAVARKIHMPDETSQPKHIPYTGKKYGDVFDKNTSEYNGATGPFKAVVNMGLTSPFYQILLAKSSMLSLQKFSYLFEVFESTPDRQWTCPDQSSPEELMCRILGDCLENDSPRILDTLRKINVCRREVPPF